MDSGIDLRDRYRGALLAAASAATTGGGRRLLVMGTDVAASGPVALRRFPETSARRTLVTGWSVGR